MDNVHKFSHSQPIADDRPGHDPERTYHEHGGISFMELLWARSGLEGCRGMILKYVWRAGSKPDNPVLMELKKSRDWLDFVIAKLEG